MISAQTRQKYTPTIGIECHVQLKTATKLFAAVGNDARGAEPNTLVSHICFGLPGALPVLNKEAVRLAVRAAFALGSQPSKFSKFDRKHYFYPDLPKGYQISQYDEPIIVGGYIDVPVYDEATKELRTVRVNIVRAHLEEDAGKNIHPKGADYSLVDLNRAGTPLLEIVSEPDIHSAVEAKAYVRELYLRMKYADVSDCDLYLGHMRFDVNVSVSKDPKVFGIRTETKNLNSFRSVADAVEYEIDRQIELLERGEAVVQETRGWDEAKQKTTAQRGKEEAHDYRYMPDPDIPPIVLDDAYVDEIRGHMPKLPDDYRQSFAPMNLDWKVREDVLADQQTAAVVAEALTKTTPEDARRIAFWLLRPGAEADEHVTERQVDLDELLSLSKMVGAGKLSSSAAKQVLDELLAKGGKAGAIAEKLNLLQVSDEGEIAKVVEKVIAENPKAVEDLKAGQERAIGFLVGQIMKLSQGKANPTMATTLIKQQLKL